MHMRLSPRASLALALALTGVAVVAAVAALGANTSGRLDRIVGTGGGAPLGMVSADQGSPAPELGKAAAWDNSAPLSTAGLRGKVVLVDFWTASCINCRRTFPFLRKLYSTYAARGLVIVGVHTPEFDFEKAHAYVARSVRELDVTWPVAEDPQRTVWDSFANQYWPANVLIDRHGLIRATHIGEGGDADIEAAVRTLLDEGGSAGAARVGSVAVTEVPGDTTPELYLGAERDAQNPPVLSYFGRFDVTDQWRTATTAHAGLRLSFAARDVYAVLAPSGSRPGILEVLLDGRPVPPGRRGPDISVDSAGRTVVRVGAEDLYHLITGPDATTGSVTLSTISPPVRLFTFTFGG